MSTSGEVLVSSPPARYSNCNPPKPLLPQDVLGLAQDLPCVLIPAMVGGLWLCPSNWRVKARVKWRGIGGPVVSWGGGPSRVFLWSCIIWERVSAYSKDLSAAESCFELHLLLLRFHV